MLMNAHRTAVQTASSAHLHTGSCSHAPTLSLDYTLPPPFDYSRSEPCLIWETAQWAAVYKPPRLPTAPLRADEKNTLVYWFLHIQGSEAAQYSGIQPDDRNDSAAAEPIQTHRATESSMQVVPAAQVRGKKAVEAGLLHRLDTDTRGLVLFAKTQACYDFLAARQDAGEIHKSYYAFTAPCPASNATAERDSITAWCTAAPTSSAGMRYPGTDNPHAKPADTAKRQYPANGRSAKPPFSVSSQFRNFGSGAKRVAPVFSGSRRYKEDKRLYTTTIESIDCYTCSCSTEFQHSSQSIQPAGDTGGFDILGLRCSLSRGYRHQVRAHLASLGLPIIGDPLYTQPSSNPHSPAFYAANPSHSTISNSGAAPLDRQSCDAALLDSRHYDRCINLQLYAIELSFPDPENHRKHIHIALPPPDKMTP